MSRPIQNDTCPKSNSVVDAVVLAGTLGSAPFELDNEEIQKPFLELGGEPLVLRVTKSVLGASGVGRVYVVGDRQKLKQIFGPLESGQYGDRLKIVDQVGSLVQNCLGTFFDYIMVDHDLQQAKGIWNDAHAIGHFIQDNPSVKSTGVVVVASDLPFVASQDIDDFVQAMQPDVSLCAGLCDHAGLVRMQQALGNQTVLDRWKLGAIPIRSKEVRWNNLWFVRPLMAHPGLYDLLQDVYSHRYLLTADGRVRWSNFWAIIRAVAHYGFKVRGFPEFIRGLLNLSSMMLASGLARWAGRAGRLFSWPFRSVLGQGDLEFVASLVLGVKTRLLISDQVGPAVDIDVPDSYLALAAHDEENYLRVLRYLGRAPGPKRQQRSPVEPGLKIISGGKS